MISERTAWCGLDISKTKFDAAFHGPGSSRQLADMPTRAFQRTREGMLDFYKWVEAQAGDESLEVRVVMEATGRYSLETAAWILADYPSLQPAIVNPRHAAAFNASLGLRNKTDKIDCRALAKMGKERQPTPYQPLSPLRQSLQAAVRQRVDYVEERTAAKNRRAESAPVAMLQQLLEKHIDHLDKTIAQIEKELERLVEKDERIKHDMKLLQSIPGVGFITAVTVIAELGDLSAFRRSRQVTSMAGVAPQVHSSGSSVHKRTKLSKQGSAHVRAALYMAARTAAVHNAPMAALYQRLKAKGKSHNSALGAVMRKLLVLMRSLVIGRNRFDPNWEPNTLVTSPLASRSEAFPKMRFVPR